jgi:hypothetical protein
LQKPVLLTTSGQSDFINFIYLSINDFISAMDGQFFPAKNGQGHWLFHLYFLILE